MKQRSKQSVTSHCHHAEAGEALMLYSNTKSITINLVSNLTTNTQKLDSHKWPTAFSRRGKRKTVQFRGMFVWIIVFYFYNNLSTHMHFITNGYKRFSKTNSTDPRQRVPLTIFEMLLVRKPVHEATYNNDMIYK